MVGSTPARTMKSYRENPEGEANTEATKQNEREAFASKMQNGQPKRFLVPAFLLVEADDADHATEVACVIASDVNSTIRADGNHLFFDEGATNVEVEFDPSGEFPHTTPAAQACIALITAYDAGLESSSVDWSDIDGAHALACRAIGRKS